MLFVKKKVVLWWEFSCWGLIDNKSWQWLGAWHAPSHYGNQYCPSFLTHLYASPGLSMLIYHWESLIVNSSWPSSTIRHPGTRYLGTLFCSFVSMNILLVMFIPIPLRPRQNVRHFADNIFKCIFLNENGWLLIEISLKFVPKGPVNNIPALDQIMAWRRPGDKVLSEPMMA